MDACVRDIIQRTKRTIGFPFKFGRKQTTLPTSTGHSASHSSDEEPVTSSVPSRPSEDSYGESESILEDERSAGPRLWPSAQNSSESEPQPSFENGRDKLQDDVQFQDSPCRIIVHNDGSAAFHALLLNEDLIVKQREIIELCRK